MNSKEAHVILSMLQRAKEEVKVLEAQYRKACECNDKIPGVKFEPQSYQKMYKTCKYHEVTYSRSTDGRYHANV
jgi:hypothetical protein